MIVSMFISIIAVPYDAVMNAHEHIWILSIFDIVSAVLENYRNDLENLKKEKVIEEKKLKDNFENEMSQEKLKFENLIKLNDIYKKKKLV